MKDNFILFDIGGTKTRIALSDGEEILGEPIIFETAQDFSLGIKTLVDKAKTLLGDLPLKGVCGGVAGPLDKGHEVMVTSPNLPSWVNQPIKKALEEALGAPVRLENDANLAGLGEAHFGAGKEERIVAYLTISTGVGGTRVVDGKIDQSAFGFEPGFQIIDSSKQIGRAQELLSGKALESRTGQNAKDINDPEIWEDLAEKLAIVINNTIVFWSPDIVVLGGPMILGNPAINLELVQNKLREILKIFPQYSKVKKAELGDLNGLYGALALLKSI